MNMNVDIIKDKYSEIESGKNKNWSNLSEYANSKDKFKLKISDTITNNFFWSL